MKIRVSAEEIEPIAFNLKYKLMKKKIPFNNLGEVIFSFFKK